MRRTSASAWPLAVVAALVCLLALTSCSLLGGHSESVRVVLDQMLAGGQLTAQQHQALLDALTAGNWSNFWEMLAIMGGSVVSSWLGVPIITNMQRGKVTARKGNPPPVRT